MNLPTCEWGHSTLCGKPATWILHPDKFPTHVYACDHHAPQMSVADRAHRLPSAPELPLTALKDYVTALAWQSVLLRDNPHEVLRAANARAKFQDAKAEYDRRVRA